MLELEPLTAGLSLLHSPACNISGGLTSLVNTRSVTDLAETNLWRTKYHR